MMSLDNAAIASAVATAAINVKVARHLPNSLSLTHLPSISYGVSHTVKRRVD